MFEVFPYKRLPTYPHMKPADVAIWDRMIKEHPEAYIGVSYDVTVGAGNPNIEHEDVKILKSGRMLSSRKIDVVGFKRVGVDVIEVKPSAGPSALGQVLAYAHLYSGYRDPHAQVTPVIITDAITNDMPYLTAHYGVRLVVV